MPNYEYLCGGCGKTSEFIQSFAEGKKRKCPKCGALKLQRQIGTGIGARFVGPGFYENDYKQKDAPSDRDS